MMRSRSTRSDWPAVNGDRVARSVLTRQKRAPRVMEAIRSTSVNQFDPSVLLIDWQFRWIIQADTNAGVPRARGGSGKNHRRERPNIKADGRRGSGSLRGIFRDRRR